MLRDDLRGFFPVLALNCVYLYKDRLIDHFGQMEQNGEGHSFLFQLKIII